MPINPANNALLTSYTPALDWIDATGGLDHYQLQVAINAGFSAPEVDDSGLAASTYAFASPLNPNTMHWWRVRSFNAAAQYSQWSAVRTFRAAMVPPLLLMPDDGDVLATLRPLFDWGDIPGATSYTLQVAANGSFTSLVMNVSPTASSYMPTSNLPRQKVLEVRVRANGPNGPSAWSEVVSFIIMP